MIMAFEGIEKELLLAIDKVRRTLVDSPIPFLSPLVSCYSFISLSQFPSSLFLPLSICILLRFYLLTILSACRVYP